MPHDATTSDPPPRRKSTTRPTLSLASAWRSDTAGPLKVLLMHGLDTSMPDGGPTARCLRRGMNEDLVLVLESMELFEHRSLTHKLAWRLRHGVGAMVLVALGFAMAVVRLLRRRRRRRVLKLRRTAGLVAALGGILCVGIYKRTKKWVVSGMFAHSLAVQRRALRKHNPDVVVGEYFYFSHHCMQLYDSILRKIDLILL